VILMTCAQKFIKGASSTSEKKPSAYLVKTPSKINARDFKFQLTTKESHKVSVRASSSLGVRIAAGRDTNGINVDANNSSANNFSLSIEGDLNESEFNAINALLDHIDKLAGQFYAGNVDQVFDKALSLGCDEQQIAGYSLDLSQA